MIDDIQNKNKQNINDIIQNYQGGRLSYQEFVKELNIEDKKFRNLMRTFYNYMSK
jgi:hypothetical protein